MEGGEKLPYIGEWKTNKIVIFCYRSKEYNENTAQVHILIHQGLKTVNSFITNRKKAQLCVL